MRFLAARLSIVACSVVALLVALEANPSVAEDASGAPVTTNAMGVAIVGVRLPADIEARSVQLTITRHQAGDSVPCVLRAPETAWLLALGEQGASLLVPVLACTDQRRFAFSTEGIYDVVWLIATGNPEAPSLELNGRVRVTASRPDDLEFVRRLADLALTYANAGAKDRAAQSPPEANDGDACRLALELAKVLVNSAHIASSGEQGSTDEKPVLADALLALAEELPDSSYAPYAAIYAGKYFSDMASGESVAAVRRARDPEKAKDRVAEFLVRAEMLKHHERYVTAMRGLSFAAEHGDAYVRPIALSHLGTLHALGGEIGIGEELVREAVVLGDVAGSVRKSLSEVEEIKKALVEKTQQPEEEGQDHRPRPSP